MGVLKIKTGIDENGKNIWKVIDDLTLNTIKSVSNSDTNTYIEIQNGELLINGDNLADYLSENTSACRVGDTNEPSGIGKTGDLYVQITSEGYSLLWYYNGNNWVRMNSIWG